VSRSTLERPGRLWRSREPERAYDTIVVGAGGHGLATAYHLAHDHGMTDVAVLERGWLAGGNMARNTTIVRSNYLWDASAALYEDALQRWEGLEAALGWNLQLRQKGVLNLAHSPQDVRDSVRRVHANRVAGIDSEWLEPDALAAFCPLLNLSPDVRYPVLGATLQRRAGTARHDAVAWAYAGAADRLGVHLIEHCEVAGVLVEDGRVAGVQTARGPIRARRVALAAAGLTSVLTEPLGLALPLQSHPLQALVSELLEPVLDCVVMSNAVHVYLSQADKGELVMGAGVDGWTSVAQRGSPHVIERELAAALELFPLLDRVHVLRTWAGVVDVTPDASPIVGPTAIDGLYVNCGWGTGGFKATPGIGWIYADTIVHDRAHPLLKPFAPERFVSGRLVDEHGAAAVAH
jgi:sarcosine oxidase subunit beta